MIGELARLSQYQKILAEFPQKMRFCFAYGSGVFKQTIDPSNNMLDLVFIVKNPLQWHEENSQRNPSHYAQPMRLLGSKAITKVQETWGAKIYYNTLVPMAGGRLVKYGVMSEVSLIEDLLDWNDLYLAGRLHKPVQILVEPDEGSQLRLALVQNLHSAIHAALLLLPEHFTETDLYKTVTNLSYNGDFRMNFGENKDKVSNIVLPQLTHFRDLYTPVLKHFEKYIEIPRMKSEAIACTQDTSPAARIHHLNQLPRMPQVKLVRRWSRGARTKDTEDCLRAIAHDPDCSDILEECLKEIVWRSSVTQSLKGIVTAGVVKSVRYSWAKVMKMVQSEENRKLLAAGGKQRSVRDEVSTKPENVNDEQKNSK